LALGEKRLAELLAAKTHRFSTTAARGRYISLKHRKCVCVEEEEEQNGVLNRKEYVY
jgi:hypothetical protein